MTGSCIPNCYFRMSCCYFRTLYLVNILISDLTHVWSQDQGSTKYIFMFTRRTKFIIYFYMCVRVIVSCNNQIFFPPSLFGQVCIFASKIRNWWPPWSEIRSALGWKIMRSTQNPVFPVTIALSVVEKNLKRTIGRKMYCACLNCWLIGTTFALGSLR